MRPIDTLHKSWNKASWSLAGIFPPIMLVVQQLGVLDVQLRKVDKIIGLYAEKQQDPPDTNLNAHLAQSYLWVLGAYEIARTIAQYSKTNTSLFSESDKTKIVELKHYFARLRVPLAKFEPAYKHRETDYMFPFPGMSMDQGTTWAVSDDTLISRNHLADSFLDVYEEIRHSQRGDFLGHDINS